MSQQRVAAVRAFNRFYTATIGVLREGLLSTPYSLTEARVLYELAQRDSTEVAELRRALDLDAGYLSRILAKLESAGLATRSRSAADARRQVVTLTKAGLAEFAALDAASAADVRALLGRLPEGGQRRLVAAMGSIRGVLDGPPGPPAFVLRPPGPGDYGWVVHRHGVRYAEEQGLDGSFEALVARVVADFLERQDQRRERAWIAESAGEPVGSVFCARKDDETAQLRLLLVEPAARGMGLGSRLVEECLRFARRAGYRRITLWTHEQSAAARRIYARAGFAIGDREPYHRFGQDLVSEHWSRDL
jgi:DNA-binding MarR family transcriptional regulator/GNAT superfamily N-acetyltransferase